MGSCLTEYYDEMKANLHKNKKEIGVMIKDRFETGDRVWTFSNGWGHVVRVTNERYSVRVQFENEDTVTYTEDGRLYEYDKNTSLFFDEIPIPETALRRPKWRADEDCVYYFVGTFGKVLDTKDMRLSIDYDRWKVSNYFKTREDAMKSKIYKAFHEEA